MSNPKKRRRADDTLSSEKKKNKKSKDASSWDGSLDTELGLNTAFVRMDNQLLADHLAQKLSRFGKELSSIELSDLTLSGTDPLPAVPKTHS